MTTSFNTISLKNLSSIYINNKNSYRYTASKFEVSMFNLDLSLLGYTLSKEAFDEILKLSIPDLNALQAETLMFLSSELGNDKLNIPLFKNFPYENFYDSEDYFEKRVISIFSQTKLSAKENTVLKCGHIIDNEFFDLKKFGACPICQQVDSSLQYKNELPLLTQKTKLKILNLVNDQDIYLFFKKLVNSKTNISNDFKDVISFVLKSKGAAVKGLLPREIENKENAAFISSLIVNIKGCKKYISSYINTATDVLRFAASCSGVENSLSTKIKFSLSKKDKDIIMFLLENIKSPLEDLKRYRSEWLILSSLIHIGSFRHKYPNASKNINILRNNEKSIKTYDSFVEEISLKITKELQADVKDALCFELATLLSERAGVFARKIDFLLRNCSLSMQDIIADKFLHLIPFVSNNVLFSVKKHLDKRKEVKFRVFMPKGSLLSLIKGGLANGFIDDSIINKVSNGIKEELLSRFSKKEHFKNVFIDPDLSKVIMPFSMRSSSSGVPFMTRGTRINIDSNSDVIRFFIQWHDIKQPFDRVDVDLSAVIFDDDFNHIKDIYYREYSNSDKDKESYFSGDIQNGAGEDGSFEAIDINLNLMKKIGRYVIMNVNSFTGQNFSEFNASAGFMERDSVGGGQAFEPKTVKHRFSLNGSCKSAVSLIIDLKTREVIWVDIPNLRTESEYSYFNNVVSDRLSIKECLETFSNFNNYKMTIAELLEFHYGRFENIDFVKNESVKYDLELNEDFGLNLAEIVSNWI